MPLTVGCIPRMRLKTLNERLSRPAHERGGGAGRSSLSQPVRCISNKRRMRMSLRRGILTARGRQPVNGRCQEHALGVASAVSTFAKVTVNERADAAIHKQIQCKKSTDTTQTTDCEGKHTCNKESL